MTGVRFRTGIFFTGEIETEMFSALLTEFKKVLIQDRPTDLTIANLHLFMLEDRGNRLEALCFYPLCVFYLLPQASILKPYPSSSWCKPRDLMGSLKGFMKGPHGILYLIGLNHTGTTGNRCANSQDINPHCSQGIEH